jgi:hypothetical protein
MAGHPATRRGRTEAARPTVGASPTPTGRVHQTGAEERTHSAPTTEDGKHGLERQEEDDDGKAQP